MAGRICVWVKCPGCGEEFRLDHEVSAEGIVSPSLDCPVCPHHAYVQLGDWNEAWMPRDQRDQSEEETE
jgi:uncharacterized Zn finger protein